MTALQMELPHQTLSKRHSALPASPERTQHDNQWSSISARVENITNRLGIGEGEQRVIYSCTPIGDTVSLPGQSSPWQPSSPFLSSPLPPSPVRAPPMSASQLSLSRFPSSPFPCSRFPSSPISSSPFASSPFASSASSVGLSARHHSTPFGTTTPTWAKGGREGGTAALSLDGGMGCPMEVSSRQVTNVDGAASPMTPSPMDIAIGVITEGDKQTLTPMASHSMTLPKQPSLRHLELPPPHDVGGTSKPLRRIRSAVRPDHVAHTMRSTSTSNPVNTANTANTFNTIKTPGPTSLFSRRLSVSRRLHNVHGSLDMSTEGDKATPTPDSPNNTTGETRSQDPDLIFVQKLAEQVISAPWSVLLRAGSARLGPATPVPHGLLTGVSNRVDAAPGCPTRKSMCRSLNWLRSTSGGAASICSLVAWWLMGAGIASCAILVFTAPWWPVASALLFALAGGGATAYHVWHRKATLIRVLSTAYSVAELLDTKLRAELKTVYRSAVAQACITMMACCAFTILYAIYVSKPALDLSTHPGFPVHAVVAVVLMLAYSALCFTVVTDYKTFFFLSQRMLQLYHQHLAEHRHVQTLPTEIKGRSVAIEYIDHHWAIACHYRIRNMVRQINDECAGAMLCWIVIGIATTATALPAFIVSTPRFNPAYLALILLAMGHVITTVLPVMQIAANIQKIRRTCSDMVGNACLDRDAEQHSRLRKLQHYLIESDMDMQVGGVTLSRVVMLKLASITAALLFFITRESLVQAGIWSSNGSLI